MGTRSMTTARKKGDPASGAFRLEDSPFYWINRTSSRYVVEMERGLKAVSMDMPRWRLLMILHEKEPRSISEISEMAAIRLSTITRVAQRLASVGMVTLRRRAGDGRKTDAMLTAKGRRAVRKVRSVAGRVYALGTHELTNLELRQLIGLLRKVFDHLSEAPLAARVAGKRRDVASAKLRALNVHLRS